MPTWVGSSALGRARTWKPCHEAELSTGHTGNGNDKVSNILEERRHNLRPKEVAQMPRRGGGGGWKWFPAAPNMADGAKANSSLGQTPRAWLLGHHSFLSTFHQLLGRFYQDLEAVGRGGYTELITGFWDSRQPTACPRDVPVANRL